MSIRKRFIEMIKNGYPEFDQEKDTVEIEFEGGGDAFGSFHYIDIWPNREGDVDLNESENQKLLLDIIDAADVAYNWNDAGTTGNIKYNEDDEQELAVFTLVSNENWGTIYAEDEEDEVENTNEEVNG
tara:strand:- start:15276 stop:15659 length:384 start_codon:yes stop_codon:yes gene_type:complete